MSYWPVRIVQNATVLVRNKSCGRAQITWIKGDRIERGRFNGGDAGIRPILCITEISLISIAPTAEFMINAGTGVMIKSLDRRFEAVWLDFQRHCKLTDCFGLSKVSGLQVAAER